MGEFELIERIRRRVRAGESVPVGIGDDAAVVQPTPGRMLVATTDSIVLDRHFTGEWAPADVGHLAMHANLSDIAAMGAQPRWVLLALTLPEEDPAWLDGFLDGFLAAAEGHDVALVGGNISSGPLNIGVQLFGEIEPDRVVRRSGARVGDVLVVSGTLGDAAVALALGEKASNELLLRLHHPQARVEAGRVLAMHARAMIDISDGLLADLGHLLDQGQGAELRLDQLPSSDALVAAVSDPLQRWRYQAGGGNDYELLAVLPPESVETLDMLSSLAGIALTVIGQISNSGELVCLDADEARVEDLVAGWDHFRS